MPEGHTIHRLAKDLNASLGSGPLAISSPQGRFASEAEVLDGATLDQAVAYGKHLFLHFEDAPPVHIHLGLIGKFRRKKLDAEIRGQIRLRVEGPERLWDLSGPMVCRLVDADDIAEVCSKLGPDPLRRDASRDDFETGLSRRRVAISAALLDQKVIAGVGNVYRSEFCFLLGIDPTTPARELTPDQVDDLWDLSVAQLTRGVRLNRIVTRDPAEVGVAAGRIKPGERLYVYKRAGDPCHRCSTAIELLEIGQRKAWWCPRCQGTIRQNHTP